MDVRTTGMPPGPYLPLVRTEPADQEQDDGHPDVGKDDAHPDLFGQRRHEAKHPWLLLHGLLDHDGDPEGHEGLGEVDDPLAGGCNGEGRDGDVGLLVGWKKGELRCGGGE